MLIISNNSVGKLRIPIKAWTDYIEEGALQQAYNLANLPFVFKWIALMADVHKGEGMPIGGVLATLGCLIPNAVGFDIGCGMRVIRFNINVNDVDLNFIREIVLTVIPTGHNHHKTPQEWEGFYKAPVDPVVRSNLESATYQLGTLGGGNHFIEFQKDSDNKLWVMIHSGSRNFGKKIAEGYNKIAKDRCSRWFSNLPTDELSFLPIEEKEGRAYYNAMNYALSFARANREHMADTIKTVIQTSYNSAEVEWEHDIHHNYAAFENHYGKNVIIHRKGATRVRQGEIGIIPGSMGDPSYIVEGLGNPLSFFSCSHGAGRKMSRKQAKKNECDGGLNLEEQIKILDDQGIIHSMRKRSNLEEAPGAYKDIADVMANQSDLVKIITELRPMANIKEDEDETPPWKKKKKEERE